MIDKELSQTTLVSGTKSGGVFADVPMLRIVFHPDRSRWGERIPLNDRTVLLSRECVDFGGTALRDPRISRRHAELVVSGGNLSLTDLNSSNGTSVNGRSVTSTALAVGDVIRVGDTFLALTREPPLRAEVLSPTIVGLSPPTIAFKQELARVAPADSTVLILGETGSGKDLAAREIHRLSGRSGAYVALNCGAIPETLLESELFGHTKGAFSGATQQKKGLFEAADGGTLFLDEIGEMALELQTRLLRVLQNKEVRPLGATRARPVDARVVAATNKDVVDAVINRQLRQDLYSRLSQRVLKLPPLRERIEDIPALVEAFKPPEVGRIEANLIEAFLAHPWPFNVRELQNMVGLATESGDSLGLGPQIEARLAEHAEIARGLVGTPQPDKTAARDETSAAPKPSATEPRIELSTPPTESELRHLLEQFGGNVYQIAQRTGKHRYQIYRWAKKCGIDVDDYREETGQG